MSAKKKEAVKRVTSKPVRPATYREWALWRMRKRPLTRQNEQTYIIGASSRVLHRPPRYLELAATLAHDQYDWFGNSNVAARELTRMRDEGLITCTDGWWWRRQPHKLKAVK